MESKAPTASQPLSAASKYSAWKSERDPFLKRGHECAKLTIPSIMPTDQDQSKRNEEITIDQPWQSIGSSGVNTLTAKFVMSILPANSPFFQFVMGRKEREELLQLKGDEADQFVSEIEARLQSLEYDVVEDMELSRLRPQLFTTVKHLLVTGNYVLFIGDKVKGYPLNRYVCRRDASGHLTDLVVREMIAKSTLDRDFLNSVKAKQPDKAAEFDGKQDVELYTVVHRVGPNKWESWQEAFDEVIPGTKGEFTDENNPWLVLRMIPIDGEDYGRAYVEELYGDLQSAEDLTKSIVQGGMIASKLLWLVRPNGVTDVDDLQEAKNGDFAPGDVEDVNALRADKMADFQVAERVLAAVTERLMRAFLMNSAVQRDAERVTAYEIGKLTQEIEDTLGGYYAILAQELQLPLVKRWVYKMRKEGRFANVPNGSIEPKIITGVDALGRGHDTNRLRGFLQDFGAVAQMRPDIARKLDADELIQRLGNGHGVPLTGLIKTDEQVAQEVAQEQQQAQMAALAEKAAGPVAGAIASNMKETSAQ